MRWDSYGKRLQNLLIPLALYLAAALLAAALPFSDALVRNLAEKTLCAAVMLWLYRMDSQVIRWDGAVCRWWMYLLAAIVGATACVGFNQLLAIAGITERLSGDMEHMSEALYQNRLWLELLTVGIAAPAAEELLFRGILYRRMRTYLSAWPAAIVAVLIFAVFHGTLLQGIYAMAFGFLILWLYEITHDLKLLILTHSSANLISVLVSENEGIGRVMEEHSVLICCVSLFLLVISCMYFQLKKGKVLQDQKDLV